MVNIYKESSGIHTKIHTTYGRRGIAEFLRPPTHPTNRSDTRAHYSLNPHSEHRGVGVECMLRVVNVMLVIVNVNVNVNVCVGCRRTCDICTYPCDWHRSVWG